MTVNVLAGPTTNLSYLGVKAETLGSEGAYDQPTVADPITDGATTMTGGRIGMSAVAGSRYENKIVVSAEAVPSGTASGPFIHTSLLLAAAMAGTTGEATTYSLELALSNVGTVQVGGAVMDTFTIKGSLNALVTYDMAFKAANFAAGDWSAVLAPPTILGIGMKGISVGGPGGAAGISFELTFTGNAKTQAKFGGVLPAFVWSAGYAVTGKATTIVTAAPLVTTDGAGISIAINLTDSGSTLKHYTMAHSYITKVGQVVRVGNLAVQDVEWIASAEAGAPLVIS